MIDRQEDDTTDTTEEKFLVGKLWTMTSDKTEAEGRILNVILSAKTSHWPSLSLYVQF